MFGSRIVAAGDVLNEKKRELEVSLLLIVVSCRRWNPIIGS